MIKSGIYQTDTNPAYTALYGSYSELLFVDVENHSLRLEANGKPVQTYIGKPLPRDEWREGCPTNTSVDKQETWVLLVDGNRSEESPIFLFAVCQGTGVVMATDTKTVLFAPVDQDGGSNRKWEETIGTITESTQMPDGSYAYTLEYEIKNKYAQNTMAGSKQGSLQQHIFGLSQQVKQGQRIKLRYAIDEPIFYEFIDDIKFVTR